MHICDIINNKMMGIIGQDHALSTFIAIYSDTYLVEQIKNGGHNMHNSVFVVCVVEFSGFGSTW